MIGPRACRSSCYNSPPGGKDELTRETSIKGSDTHTITLAVLRAFTPVLASISPSTNELFKQFMKAYLEAQTQHA